MTCTDADAPVLRFLFDAAMQPLMGKIMSWAHSARSPGAAPHTSDPPPAASNTEAPSCGLAHPEAHLPQLPHFLKPVQGKLFLAGFQLRFLASLPPCAPTIAALERTSVLQMQQLRELQGPELSLGGHAPVLGQEVDPLLSREWTMHLAWDWPAASRMGRVLTARQEERCLLLAGLKSDLDVRRQAAGDVALAEQLEKLQARQAALVEREQAAQAERAQLLHEKRQLLEEQREELAERERSSKV